MQANGYHIELEHYEFSQVTYSLGVRQLYTARRPYA